MNYSENKFKQLNAQTKTVMPDFFWQDKLSIFTQGLDGNMIFENHANAHASMAFDAFAKIA